jgi:hypothetical protein
MISLAISIVLRWDSETSWQFANPAWLFQALKMISIRHRSEYVL